MIYKRTDAYGKEAPNTGMNYKGNENQNPNEYHSYLIQEVSVDEDVEKLEPLVFVGGKVKWYDHCEK